MQVSHYKQYPPNTDYVYSVRTRTPRLAQRAHVLCSVAGRWLSRQGLALSAAVLRGPWPAVKTLKGTDLWSDGRPTVVYTIRRLG